VTLPMRSPGRAPAGRRGGGKHRLHRQRPLSLQKGNPLILFTWTYSSLADQILHLLLDLRLHAFFSLNWFCFGWVDGSGLQIKRARFPVFVLILKEYMRVLD
jgi:hypothetical protein